MSKPGWIFSLLMAAFILHSPYAIAADLCEPVLLLKSGAPMTIASDTPGPSIWLEAALVQPFEVNGLAADLGLASGAQTTLKRDLPLRGVPLGRQKIEGDQATMQADRDVGEVLLQAGDRRVVARIANALVRDVEGNRLKVSPNLEGQDVEMEVLSGAQVRALDADRGELQPGAKLRWLPQPGTPLRFYLLQATRLAETTASATGHVSTLKPAVAPSGGKLRVVLDTAGLDLRTRFPTFCLVGKDFSMEASAQFISQASDKTTFELRISPEAADRLREGQNIWQRIQGVPAELRAVAYANQQPVMDQRLILHVSSARWASLMGVLLLVVLCIICAVPLGRLNPIAIGGDLIRQQNGKYSLSNLQVLLWTMMVLFSLTFAWVSTGELLLLSNDVLKMLGIVGGSSILARTADRLDPGYNAAASAPTEPTKKDLVADKDGHFDLLRFQMLSFTLFSLVYSLASVLRSDGLPELPESLYWLMGISNATYVAGKVPAMVDASSRGSASVETADDVTPAEQALPKARIEKLQTVLGVAVSGKIDTATREAVKRYQTTNSLYPANGRVTDHLLAYANV